MKMAFLVRGESWSLPVEVPLTVEEFKKLRQLYRERCLLYAPGERGPRTIARAVLREQKPALYEGDNLMRAACIELGLVTDAVEADGERWTTPTLWAGAGAAAG